MRYDILLSPGAVAELKSLPAFRRAQVRDAMELHLRHEPTKVSRSRIKRLRGLSHPQFRLRVGEVRIFYDVTESAVEVLAILEKQEAERWLTREGEGSPGGPGG